MKAGCACHDGWGAMGGRAVVRPAPLDHAMAVVASSLLVRAMRSCGLVMLVQRRAAVDACSMASPRHTLRFYAHQHMRSRLQRSCDASPGLPVQPHSPCASF